MWNRKANDPYYLNVPICDAWKEFLPFYAEMGDRPEGLEIDRIDGTKGYEPGNCRWATRTVQNRNSLNCRWIEFDGKRKLLTDWADELGITPGTLSERLEKWGVEKAMTVPRGQKFADQTHEQNPAAKLTMAKAEEIRIRLLNGATKKGLAREFGVSDTTVRMIERRFTWA